MYCVTVLYPQQDSVTFDFDYYTSRHMPMAGDRFGDNVIKAEVRKGFSAPDGSAPAFACVTNIWIRSVKDFQAALAQHGAEILGDIPNYTNSQPVLQIDEVMGQL